MGIGIKNINYLKDGIEFEIKHADYKQLIKYIKSYKFRIKRYPGIFNVFSSLKTNRIFIFNLILGLILLYIFSNTIVSVKVYHSNKYIRNILYSSLEEYGIKRLSWKKSYKELLLAPHISINHSLKSVNKLDLLETGMNFRFRDKNCTFVYYSHQSKSK